MHDNYLFWFCCFIFPTFLLVAGPIDPKTFCFLAELSSYFCLSRTSNMFVFTVTCVSCLHKGNRLVRFTSWWTAFVAIVCAYLKKSVGYLLKRGTSDGGSVKSCHIFTTFKAMWCRNCAICPPVQHHCCEYKSQGCTNSSDITMLCVENVYVEVNVCATLWSDPLSEVV